MEDKEKRINNNEDQQNSGNQQGSERNDSDYYSNEQSAKETKRHYFGFGEKVIGSTSSEMDNTYEPKSYTRQDIYKHENNKHNINEQDIHKHEMNEQHINAQEINKYGMNEQHSYEMNYTQKQPHILPNQTFSAYNEPSYEQGTTSRPYSIDRVEQASSHQPFTVNEKKKNKGSAITKYFLMFIASVLVVGSVMFLSDKYNWFTSNSAVSNVGDKKTNNATDTGQHASVQVPYLEDRPDNISELFKAASPAVVKIETYSEVSYNNSNSLFNDPFFRQFFGDSYVPRQQENEGQSELQQSGMGTGFFFDEAGYILTNQHVIGDAKEIRVIVEGYDEPFIAELLGSSFDLDLAVIKLNEQIKFPTLEIGSSEQINIGDWVVAIGNPYGFDHTLTVGVISAKERPINITDTDGERNYTNLLQTDASINPGNSGGPLLNLYGQVIGINTAVSSQAQGIGFAIPTSTIIEVLDYLKENKEIPKEPIPFIGISMSQVTENMLEGTGLTKPEGVRVENIVYGSPAYTGGLNQYDIITKIDDTVVESPDQLGSYVKSKQVGDVVNVYVIRRGEAKVIAIELGDQNNYATQN